MHKRRQNKERPLTNDVVLSLFHFENPQDELDHTTRILRKVLLRLGGSLHAGTGLIAKAGALWVAAAAATRIGGPEFVEELLMTFTGDSSCLFRPAQDKLTARVEALIYDLLRRRVNPFTQAHLPQSLAHHAIAGKFVEHKKMPQFIAQVHMQDIMIG